MSALPAAPATAVSPLNVTNGDCAGSVLLRSELPGPVLSWQDVLHEGPLAPVPPAALRELRARFLAGAGWGDVGAIGRALQRRNALLQRTLATGGQVVLWFEHDLVDQLQLLQILALLGEWEIDLESVQLVVVGDVTGRASFHGLGELEPEEMEQLAQQRRPLTREMLELGRKGWQALTAADPRELERLLASDTSALPYLAGAVTRLLEELPDPAAGLSRTERQALETVEEGARTPLEVFHANAEREEAPFLGDAWMWVRLRELGSGPMPLLAAAGGARLPAPPLGDEAFVHARIELTATGRAVLTGEADRVDAIGIDRWLGGTHLRAGNVWRWDAAQSRLLAPS